MYSAKDTSKLPPIPLGYRELELNENIEEGDLVFNTEIQDWKLRRIYGNPYRPIHNGYSLHAITIRKSVLIEISEEKKNSIISYLKENRAFNEDSALKIILSENYLIYCELARQNIIKRFDGNKFFI